MSYMVMVIIQNCDESYQAEVSGIIHKDRDTAEKELLNLKNDKYLNKEFTQFYIKEVEE